MSSNLRTTRLVHAAPERVFEVFTDLDGAPARVRGIEALERLDDGPIGAGTRWRETRTLFGKSCTEVLELTSFDAPRSYTVGCRASGSEFTTAFRFVPEGEGTRVEIELSVVPLTFFAKVAAPMSKLMLKACMKAMESDLDDLAAVCEGQASAV